MTTYDGAGRAAGSAVEVCDVAVRCAEKARGSAFPDSCTPSDECEPFEPLEAGDDGGCRAARGGGASMLVVLLALLAIIARMSAPSVHATRRRS